MRENREKAEKYLTEYRILNKNEKIIREQMFEIEKMLGTLRISSLSTVPKHGGGSKYEDYLVNQISKKEELRIRLVIVTARKAMIKRSLEILSGNEFTVAERFYISGERKGAAEELMEKLGFEKSHIYRIKDAALDKIYNYLITACVESEGKGSNIIQEI